jgi:hypothetical protein
MLKEEMGLTAVPVEGKSIVPYLIYVNVLLKDI